MGIRQRVRRKNRRRQRSRARARRRAAMALWRPRCLECDILLVEDAFEADVWHCALCGSTFLRQGCHLLPQHDEIFFLVEDSLREAA
ncbi:MAG: hypothetical protein ACYTKD_20180 [Planctomycetota bacterium]